MLKLIRNIGFVILGLYIWYVLCKDIQEEEDEKENEQASEVFIPSSEWKTVKKGQKIPPGLHVRMNLETGVTEARLLNSNNEQTKTQAVAAIKNDQADTKEKTNLLKNFQLKDRSKGDELINPDELKQLTKKYRRYDELKKELDEINLIPKTEAELLTEIIDQLKGSTEHKKGRTLKLLEDLEFLVHQIDNAIEFTKQNGFTDIVYKNLNSTDSRIKTETLKLFSSLVQNNPKVKVEAVETGGISLLLKILSLDNDDTVKFRATTALSCLLRRFPYAQLKFIENGGLTVVTKLFDSSNVKIKLKLATLLSDLLTESRDVDEGDEFHIKKQYESVNLENLLLEHQWCDNLKSLLDTILLTDGDSHDSVEKCLIAIKAIVHRCSGAFEEDIFRKLGERYTVLAIMDEDKAEEISNTLYYSDLTKICNDILQYLPSRTNIKTEL